MSAEQLDGWAHEAHRLAAHRPHAYARRIVALALLGTVILHSLWVLSLALAAVFVSLAVTMGDAWPVLPATLCVGLAAAWLWKLFQPIRSDDGIELDRRTAPKLFELIEEVARELGAPMPTHVWLMPELNAHVQVARRPWGEWKLTLGLPLMLAEDLPQFKSTVGHELGHFVSGTAGARLVWSQKAGWHSTLAMLGSSRLGGLVRRTFGAWGRRFQAEAVAMARTHERSSDLAGAKVTSKAVAAQALIIENLLERAMSERFWPGVWARIGQGPPPEDVFQDLRHFLEALDRSDVDRYFRAALQEKTLTFDVHPCLADRVGGLGERPTLPEPPRVSAAVALLGDQLDELSLRLGRWWANEVKEDWNGAQKEVRQLEERLARGRPAPTEMHPHDALELARALRRAGQVSESVPYYRRAVSLVPGDSAAHLGLGLALLETGDPLGLTELKLALSIGDEGPEGIWMAFAATRRFLEARGEPEKNPFTKELDRLRLRWGRARALHEWGRPALR